MQLVTFTAATGGTYTLTFDHEHTGAIDYTSAHTGPGAGELEGDDAKAAQVALEALPGLSGNVSVTEATNLNDEVAGLFVEFVGSLGETEIAALEVDGGGLAPAGAGAEVGVEREGSKFVGEVISKFTSAGSLVGTWGDHSPANGQLTGVSAPGGRSRASWRALRLVRTGICGCWMQGRSTGSGKTGRS
jgi:hypothetical protein